MTPTLRSGNVDDAGALLALWRQAGSEPGHTDDVASIRRLIAHDPDALILAELDGSLVGAIIAAWDGWRGSIYRLAVAPAYRRRGIGGRLLEEAERRLELLGANRLQAIVVSTDARATSFWHASSWDEQQARIRFVRG